MSDIADAASDREQWFRDQALDAARPATRQEMPLERDGTRLCRDCHDPIPAQRLAIQPTAVRCTECQGYVDKEHR